MLALGFDPGVERTGWGAVAKEGGSVRPIAWGLIRTARGTPLSERLLRLRHEAVEVIARTGADVAVVERLYFNRNVTSAIDVGHARGVILLSLAEEGVPILEVTPPEIKRAVTGYGGAPKTQMMQMVRRILSLAGPIEDDEADALAASLCGVFRKGA